MRMNRIKKKTSARMFWKIKLKPQGLWILSAFLILVLLGLSLGTIQGTLGKFSRSFTTSDSAAAAKFDVAVTAPEEFWLEQDENYLKLHFLSNTDTKAFYFQVSNDGEADVVCTPHINNDVEYHILVSEAECTEFIVNAKDTVGFWLIVGSGGLDGNIKEAKFSVDTRQLEGG